MANPTVLVPVCLVDVSTGLCLADSRGGCLFDALLLAYSTHMVLDILLLKETVCVMANPSVLVPICPVDLSTGLCLADSRGGLLVWRTHL